MSSELSECECPGCHKTDTLKIDRKEQDPLDEGNDGNVYLICQNCGAKSTTYYETKFDPYPTLCNPIYVKEVKEDLVTHRVYTDKSADVRDSVGVAWIVKGKSTAAMLFIKKREIPYGWNETEFVKEIKKAGGFIVVYIADRWY